MLSLIISIILKKKKKARNMLLKGTYNHVSVWQLFMPDIRKSNSASNYTLILGKLFHIYKLIHID